MKVDARDTVLSLYKQISQKGNEPQYAYSTPYEEGPEIGLQNGLGTIYNKPVAVLLNKLFHLDVELMSDDGPALLDSLYQFILERVGRNRTYTRTDVKTYLIKASAVYAALRAAQGSIKAQRDVPGVALETGNQSARIWREYYETVAIIANKKYPLPKTIADFIDEYVVPYLEDKKGAFERPFVVCLQALEVYDYVSEQSIEFQFTTENTSVFNAYFNAPLSSTESSFARDVETTLVTKKLPVDPYDAPVYPLDAKHRCDLINTVKGQYIGIDATRGLYSRENNRLHIRSVWNETDKTFAAVSHTTNIEPRSILMTPAYNPAIKPSADLILQSPVAIDFINFVTMTGEDDEPFPGDMIVNSIVTQTEIDELMIAVNYVELFGGLGFSWDNYTNIRCVQVDPFYTYAFGLTEKNVKAIKARATIQVFDFELITNSRNNKEEKKKKPFDKQKKDAKSADKQEEAPKQDDPKAGN